MKNKEAWIGLLIFVLLVVSPGLLAMHYASSYEEESDVHKILMVHNFNTWSEADQKLLTDMMRATVMRESIEPYLDGANREVLETYIDLLEEAGY